MRLRHVVVVVVVSVTAVTVSSKIGDSGSTVVTERHGGVLGCFTGVETVPSKIRDSDSPVVPEEVHGGVVSGCCFSGMNSVKRRNSIWLWMAAAGSCEAAAFWLESAKRKSMMALSRTNAKKGLWRRSMERW